MEQTLFTLPILPGKTGAARAFLQELEGPRKEQLAARGQSVGITKETWAIQQTPQGDFYVAYMAGDNIAEAFQPLQASESKVEVLLKQQL